MLRDYQQRAIDQLYDWFRAGNKGNPCLVLPTGAGKSHIVAELCKDALTSWPDTRIMMLTHVKELISQNAEKLRSHWPNAPMGIYSAGIGRRELGEPITFAGVQSVERQAHRIGHVDLVVIDECHLLNNDSQGRYRELIDVLLKTNPNLRIVGLTATPFRLGQGLLTEGDQALFSDILEPVTIEELIFKGYLAPLRSKPTEMEIDTSGVKKRGGEYVKGELERTVDTEINNAEAVEEIIRRAEDRRSWLIFCAGVDHSVHIRDELKARGISAECITGKTPKGERARIIADFKAGRITALTNANVLTTGFDHPDIDLIAMLRPTMSPTLYVQMAGRGLRPKSHTDHCLVLDFAGVVEQHGPITAVQPPKKKGQGGEGDTPVKVCDNCHELVHLSVMECPACGWLFPEPEDKETKWRLRSDDIMGIKDREMAVTDWAWRRHTSKRSGKEMVKVIYYGQLSDKPVTEYFPVTHEGFVGRKAIQSLYEIANKSGADGVMTKPDLDSLAEVMTSSNPPAIVRYKPNGKLFDITEREWSHEAQ